MRESQVERYLVRRARELDGDAFKLAPVHAGMPDRLVILPPGQLLLVELKAPDGRLAPIQQVWHQRAADKGIKVHVCWTPDQVEGLLMDRVQRASGKVSAAKRWGNPPLAEAQQELAEARLERKITEALAQISPEGRRRLADLLTGEDLL